MFLIELFSLNKQPRWIAAHKNASSKYIYNFFSISTIQQAFYLK